MPRKQESFIYNSGVYNTGDNNKINNAHGSEIRQENTSTVMSAGGQDAWEQLAGELARIRQRLEEDHSNCVAAVDREDAMDAVTTLQSDLPGIAASGPGALETLRRRLRGLLGALDPVVKIIGTVATVQGILDHFK